MDEPGKVYYVVVNRTTDDPPGTPPTVSEVKSGTYAGTTACGVISVTAADTNATASVSTTADRFNADCSPADYSLCPIVLSESRYWVYVVAEDDETTPNEQTTTTRLAVTTTDITPPAFTDEGTGEVNITSNERRRTPRLATIQSPPP